MTRSYSAHGIGRRRLCHVRRFQCRTPAPRRHRSANRDAGGDKTPPYAGARPSCRRSRHSARRGRNEIPSGREQIHCRCRRCGLPACAVIDPRQPVWRLWRLWRVRADCRHWLGCSSALAPVVRLTDRSTPPLYAAAGIGAPAVCTTRDDGFMAPRISLARATSAAVPCAMTRNPSAFMAVSYWSTLSFGIPML